MRVCVWAIQVFFQVSLWLRIVIKRLQHGLVEWVFFGKSRSWVPFDKQIPHSWLLTRVDFIDNVCDFSPLIITYVHFFLSVVTWNFSNKKIFYLQTNVFAASCWCQLHSIVRSLTCSLIYALRIFGLLCEILLIQPIPFYQHGLI